MENNLDKASQSVDITDQSISDERENGIIVKCHTLQG